MTEIKTTKIPQRQECVNKEHPYIGGAKDVIDDELGKPQSELNAEMKSITDQMVVSIQGDDVQLTADPDDIVVGGGKVPTANAVAGKLATKQDTLEDLDDIRSGSSLGSTAVQPAGMTDALTELETELKQDTREVVNEALENFQPIVVEGDVNNAPDEEDLTSVNVGGTDVLKFKDKVYDTTLYSGLGRVYLRKNMVNGVNTLTQDMFYKGEVGSRVPNTNTIYVIQYDFTLGEDITVPENCVLEFDGGSISGQSVDLNNADIVSPLVPIFKGTLLSTLYKKEVYAEWFNILPGTVVNSTIIQNLVRYCHIIRFGEGTFNFSSSVALSNNDAILAIIGAEHGRSRFPVTVFNFTDCDGFNISVGAKRIENIKIAGNNVGIWNESNQIYDDTKCGIKSTEAFGLYRCAVTGFGYGIKIENGDLVSLYIRFTDFYKCLNDAIYLAPRTLNNAIIEGCYFASNGKNGGVNTSESTTTYSGHGININKGNGVSIINNVFEYNAGCGIIVQNLGAAGPLLTAIITGNDFEHNKYTQVFIARDNDGGDKIFVQGNFYTDAQTALPSNALPQRTACIALPVAYPFNRRRITLEELNFDAFMGIEESEKKAFAYKYCKNNMWAKEGNTIVSKTTTNAFNRVWCIWRIPHNGLYRVHIEAKVSAGTARFLGIGLQKIGGVVQNPYTLSISSTDYQSANTDCAYFEERDIVRIATTTTVDRTVSGSELTIKEIQLQEARTHGTTSQRPTLTADIGVGTNYFNEETNKQQVWNGSEWIDLN